jgi:hypothetical protein
MVRIAPNWAHVSGTVLGVEDPHDTSGFLEVTISIDAIRSVARARNLFEQQPGEMVRVLMSPDLVERLRVRPGCGLEADVRRADLHRSFVHPERIQVSPPPEDVDEGEVAPAEMAASGENGPREEGES